PPRDTIRTDTTGPAPLITPGATHHRPKPGTDPHPGPNGSTVERKFDHVEQTLNRQAPHTPRVAAGHAAPSTRQRRHRPAAASSTRSATTERAPARSSSNTYSPDRRVTSAVRRSRLAGMTAYTKKNFMDIDNVAAGRYEGMEARFGRSQIDSEH